MAIERNLFERFGGIRPMADVLGEAPSTVQSWKTTGRIPSTKQPEVLARADASGIDITADDVVFPLKARPDRTCDAVEISAAIGDCDRHPISQSAARA